MGERKTYTVRVQPDLMKTMKMLSVEKDANVSDLLEEAIKEYLKRGTEEAKKKSKK